MMINYVMEYFFNKFYDVFGEIVKKGNFIKVLYDEIF